jgi:FAD/FMN-containing dehydrogenase
MDHLLYLLSPVEVITPQSDPAAYDELTTFWCAQANQKPIAVVAPTDAQSLAKVLAYLYNHTELNIRFLGSGFTGLPAKDILLSMHKFDSFSYNPDEKTITVGAGQQWRGVYEALDKVAPKFIGT